MNALASVCDIATEQLKAYDEKDFSRLKNVRPVIGQDLQRREYMREYMREYRKTHKIQTYRKSVEYKRKCKEYDKRYREKMRSIKLVKEEQFEITVQRREYRREYMREYRKTHPLTPIDREKRREYKRRYREKMRAKKLAEKEQAQNATQDFV